MIRWASPSGVRTPAHVCWRCMLGRARRCTRGSANWDEIAQAWLRALDIPVLGNGDIKTAAGRASVCIEHTKAVTAS